MKNVTPNEQLVLLYALAHGRLEPAGEASRTTCERLARRGFLMEMEGPDPRFTIFVPTEKLANF